MKTKFLSTLFCGLLAFGNMLQANEWPKNYLNDVTVADLLSQAPGEGTSSASCTLVDQALYGEPLKALEEVNGWLHVQTSQQRYDGSAWQPVDGWISAKKAFYVDQLPEPNLVVTATSAHIFTGMDKANDESSYLLKVPMGSYLVGESETLGWWKVRLNNGAEGYLMGLNVTTLSTFSDMSRPDLRNSLVATAKKLDGTPYLTGGRCPSGCACCGQRSGVDSGGLINLVYRSNGIESPRAAQDLWLSCETLSIRPQPADLVFLQDESSGKVVHVMMVVDNENLIEATGLTQSVRQISAHERLGRSLDTLSTGDRFDGYTILFGSLLR